MGSTTHTSMVCWSLPYLFVGVDTGFIPVVVQQTPTLAQCCQILHNRVQSFFFICKERRDNWDVQSENTALQIQTYNTNGSKDTMSSLPIERHSKTTSVSPSPVCLQNTGSFITDETQWDVIVPTWKSLQESWRRALHRDAVTGQKKMPFNWKRAGLDWISGRNFPLWGWWSCGCPIPGHVQGLE